MRIASSVPACRAIRAAPGPARTRRRPSRPRCGRGRSAPGCGPRAASRWDIAGGTAAHSSNASSPAAVEQPGFGQHQRAAAGGIELRALRVHALDPVEHAPVERACSRPSPPGRSGQTRCRCCATSAIASCGMMLTPVMSWSGPAPRDQARLEQRLAGRLAWSWSQSRPAAHSVSNHAVDDRRIALAEHDQLTRMGFLGIGRAGVAQLAPCRPFCLSRARTPDLKSSPNGAHGAGQPRLRGS